MTIKIDLAELTKGGQIRNLAGKDRGEAARVHFNLDATDSRDELVQVVVPADLYAVSSSFFLGLFSKSIERLGGKKSFLDRYKFDASQQIMRQIYEGIERATMSRGPITNDPRRERVSG